MKSIVEMFHEHTARCIDERGVYPLTMEAHDLTPLQVYQRVITIVATMKPSELVFGLDRFCKEGQGTTLGDCVTAAHWNGRLWLPFIIEYQHEPRIVKPVDWNNAFWNEKIMGDIRHFQNGGS